LVININATPYLGVQPLAHFDSAGGHRDGPVAFVDADVAVVWQGEVVDGVLARDESDATLAPRVRL
jgi:hypothetical protein